MTDSLLFPWSGHRLSNSSGSPQNASYFEVYDAGTNDQRTTYIDSGLTTPGAWPITADGGGLCPARYLGVGAYKVVAKKSDGSTLWTEDDFPGALDTSGFGGSGTAAPRTPVSVIASSRSITSADFGKVLSVNPTSGDVILPFPAPAGITNGDGVTLIHTGTANAAVLTFSGQDPHVLSEPGEAVRVVSTAAAYLMVSDKSATAPTWYPRITDRLTSAPASPTTGAYYLINGTPTGVWSTLGFQEHDLVRYDGNGSYILYRPTTDCMWLGTIADEDMLVQFRGSAWVDLSNVTAPTTSTLKHALFLDQRADGIVGGTATTGAWTTATIQTEKTNTITGCSLATNAITLPAGTYSVRAAKFMSAANGQGLRLKLANGGSPIYYEGINNPLAGSEKVTLHAFAAFTLASSDTLTLEYYAQNSGDTGDLGEALAISGNLETYAAILIEEKTSQQGPTGAQGAQGTDGLDAAYPYQWSTSTSGDPGTGKVAGNNATIASITQLQISETDSAGGSMAAVIATWDDSTSTNRATVKISKEGATQNFHSFRITGAGTDAGTYWTFPVTYIATSGTISNADNCAVLVIEKGDKGDTGATGSAGVYSFDYTFSTTTTSGPSTGTIRANHATLSSATALYIHETDRLGVSQAAAIAQWDDSTTTVRGYLTLIDLTTPANRVRFSITGANTDNGSDDTITVTYVSGVTSLTAVNVAVLFERVGDKGADGAGSGDFVGPASSTDNAVVRFDGLTGKLGQNATVTISDTGTIAGVQAITLSANDAGALGASGTAFADLFLASGGVINWNAGDVTATHSANALAFAGASSGYSFDAAVLPSANDAAALGAAATSWADLFLADGGVINWANGAMTITGAAGATDQMYFQGAANGYFFSNVVGPYTNDGAALGVATTNMWSDLFLASGAVINFNAGDVTVTHSANTLAFGGASSGYTFDAATTPSANDAAALGSATVSWSDLFLASGAVVNFNNGNVTLTHSAATLTLAGATSLAMGTSIAVGLGTIELGAASDTTLSRLSAGVLGVEGKTVATLSTSQAWTAHQYVTLGTLTDGANISWDVSTAQKAKVTLGGNRTMNAVSNAVEGATYTLWVIQDGTGSRTITWTSSGAGSFDFGTDGSPTLTTTASKADLLAFEAISIGGTLKLRYMGIKKGFT